MVCKHLPQVIHQRHCMSAVGCHICTNSSGPRNASLPSAASLFKQGCNQRSNDGPARVLGVGRQRETSAGTLVLCPGSLLAPTTGEKDACLEALMEQQDWDEASTNRWLAGRSRVRVSPTQHIPRVKALPHNLRQTLPAMNSPPPLDHAVTMRQSTLSKGHHPTTMTFDMQARQSFSGRNTSTLSLFLFHCAHKRWDPEERLPSVRNPLSRLAPVAHHPNGAQVGIATPAAPNQHHYPRHV